MGSFRSVRIPVRRGFSHRCQLAPAGSRSTAPWMLLLAAADKPPEEAALRWIPSAGTRAAAVPLCVDRQTDIGASGASCPPGRGGLVPGGLEAPAVEKHLLLCLGRFCGSSNGHEEQRAEVSVQNVDENSSRPWDGGKFLMLTSCILVCTTKPPPPTSGEGSQA